MLTELYFWKAIAPEEKFAFEWKRQQLFKSLRFHVIDMLRLTLIAGELIDLEEIIHFLLNDS